MGGSTGIISKVISSPVSNNAETNREIQTGIASFPGLHDGVRQTFGYISELHPEKPLIKAYADDGTKIAHDKYIVLNHSTSEIAERWGTVRVGMRIKVEYTGPDGGGASATIVGLEGEKVAEEILIDNNIQRGLFAIFSPGIGLG